jgi:hypothetical protein
MLRIEQELFIWTFARQRHRIRAEGRAMKCLGVWLLPVLASTMMLAQINPVPFVDQPLVPTSSLPGGPSFTLTVNGTGFVSGAMVKWNGTALSTTLVSSSQLKAAVPASNIAAAATASVTVFNPAPGGGTSSVAFFPVSAPTTLQFTSFASVSGSDYGVSPLAADFTGNGKLDFAIDFCESVCAIEVYLGNGAGTFVFLDQTPGSLTFFAAGDFNGDGILDLVGTNCVEQACAFYIELGNGDGTFAPPGNGVALPVPSGQIVTGDFNGDGHLDVAIQAGTSGLYVFLGNGDGTFQNALISNVGNLNSAGGALGGVGDFNGDGKLDVIGVLANNQLGFIQGNGDGRRVSTTLRHMILEFTEV